MSPSRRAPDLQLLPGVFPPASAGFDGQVRRILLLWILAIMAIGDVVFLVTGTAPFPRLLLVGTVGAIGVCLVPWHRLEPSAFGIVGALLTVWVVLIVHETGGLDSPYGGLIALAVFTSAATTTRAVGTVLAVAAALTSAVPFLYDIPQPTDMQLFFARLAILLLAAVFIPWLVAEIRRATRVAAGERELLGREQEVSAELRRAQNLRQEYMSVLAHELRNPLIAIGAAGRVLAKEVSGRPSESKAQGIVTEVGHALELLDGLTDVSSIESGRFRFALHPMDLASVVRETVRLLAAPEHQVGVRGADKALVVLGDDRRLAQVIRNLVVNAAKYSPSDTKIDVRLGTSGDRKWAIVEVRDEGPGVPPLERGRLFEKFARLSTAGATRGSGLGLYISRGIIKDHGGELWADWPPGGGSVFSFRVPLAIDAARGD